MKQFLHTSKGNLVVALQDHAFALVCARDGVIKPYELVPKIVTEEENTGKNDNKEAITSSEGSSVQAVSSFLMKDDTLMLCAVTRSDKILSIYSIDLKDNDDNKPSAIQPIANYKTQKRACAVEFALVPGESPILIVIAGDLTGDATAFPVPLTEKNDVNQKNNNISRILLGHTASMLTGVHVVSSSKSGKSRILTSDRDEKVRVSSFPNCFEVEGFLLGHTAFISALDVPLDNNDSSVCVTCSGDGTVRLWDYESCTELASVEAIQLETQQDVEISEGDDDDDKNTDNQKEGDNELNEKKEEMPFKTSKDNADTDDKTNYKKQSYTGKDIKVVIPVNVAISQDASYVSVVREEMNSVDVYQVLTGNKEKGEKTKMEKKKSIECQSQPLSTKFMNDGSLVILTRDPTYLLHCEANSFSVLETSELCTTLISAAKKFDISMPSTVLEKDQFGNVKMVKNTGQTRNAPKYEPWNNSDRIMTAKKASSRRKKRQKESLALESTQ